MPTVQPCRWDNKTLPYVPEQPCLLYYLIPGDDVSHMAVPNARGEYPNLIPGMPYLEELLLELDNEEEIEDNAVLPLVEYAPPPLTADAGVQVEWTDVPIPPPPHMMRYVKPLTETTQSVTGSDCSPSTTQEFGGED
ncbi:uncharacterized protein TEOVI_000555900 [Trypanosoma equiperdum]|uniref:Uncharacterized protein n=4 Tax=Trypanozoon TaxID=39700 RepID=Q57XL4_TRYB2|nr:hypothetical protein, conserved [Trypanosoma brucei gambiense DAL972]XP_845883.1 hypothetical protein, conserved [Trypanosoma brucei brucei TREU927]AAX69655.1 hypothetical protein, conserved [Trypanosoma brucei]RHW71582.1 hypothetical protein DPX39_070034600 [Trypanosoma brucei equiperdum]SCU67869.1 hypothetical protein, conserved [Trypanosoma equiperdum]AAZ12324.1 hypothetical protein, conserved [Trypanosoma brucei brucei TREU927]CBH12339.1 hypothetical protein, conserved [Trypanosoma bru|eukprot:XP_011774620.1 hypothetical protein, conserved [Trypanosoma brucei gambiense DAL972]